METHVNTSETLVREISQPLEKASGWIKFLALFMLIYGGLMALSIVGLIIAWLPIWLGVLLLKASNKSRYAFHSGDKNSLIEALLSLNNYFIIYAVMTIIGIVFGIVLAVFLLMTGFMTQGFDPERFIF
jgi:hypothetical protein